jgi:hypothetical protein
MLTAALLVFLQAAAPPQEPAGPTAEEVRAQEERLLQRLANPLASLASLKLTADFDYHVGPLEEGHRTTLLVQPTIPIHLGDEWNLISRTVLPVIYQEDVAPGVGNQSGVGDLTEILFVAAVQPGGSAWIWGVGPLIRIPTGSDDLLTSRKVAVGPAAALVRQEGDFTVGVILSQFWSVRGSSQAPDVEIGTVEPFVTYRTEGLWNLTLHIPCLYDFHAHQWTIPAALTVEKLVSFQRRPVTISFGLRYWADSSDAAAHDLGFEFSLTIVFPN